MVELTTKLIRCLVMLRVSSTEQRDEGYSLAAQRTLLVGYASHYDLQIDRIFEISETASKPDQRRVFQEMMAYATKHRIKVIVVEKVDRLTRNFKDSVAMDEWLKADKDRRIHFVKNSLVLHQGSSSQETLQWDIHVVLAKNHAENLAEETTKGVQAKLAAGGWPAKAPVGYRNVQRKDGHREIAVHKDKSKLVAQLFGRYLEPGVTEAHVTTIAEQIGLTTSNGRPLVRSQIGEMLRNRFYIGTMTWQGRALEGTHKQFIDWETFQAVQDKLSSKGAPKRRILNPLFRGLVKCSECHALISWELQKGRYYGSCHGTRPCANRKFIREDKLEKQIRDVLDSLAASNRADLDWALAEVQVREDDVQAAYQAKTRQLTARFKDLERQEDILYRDRLAERVSLERYKRMEAQMQSERQSLEADLRKGGDKWKDIYAHNLGVLKLSQQLGTSYDGATKEERQFIMDVFFASLEVRDRNLVFKWTPIGQLIAETAQKDMVESRVFEPVNNGLSTAKKPCLSTRNSTWYPLTSLIRTFGEGYTPSGAERVRELLDLVAQVRPAWR